ncbi:MAG TPA: glutathione S-transferase family protein [Polyangiaceae bacterium]|nr:glutathione S-transferase family protein [Polyangiaceae bacterium]
MTKPKLTYFDAPVSRGEECRLALHIAGVDFEDVRVQRAEWAALKPQTPFGSLPLFELPGKPVLAQSNAILVLIGRRHGLHPKDDFEAARHEAMMQHVEELRAAITPTLRMTDESEKKTAREALAASYLPNWAANVERQIAEGPFFAGSALHVVDLKLYVVVRWLAGGTLDHVPATTFAPYAKLMKLHDSVRDDSRVRAWYERR